MDLRNPSTIVGYTLSNSGLCEDQWCEEGGWPGWCGGKSLEFNIVSPWGLPWKASATVEKVQFEAFRAFGDSQYAVTISRCQQLALEKSSHPVPLPSEQLTLANQKKDKESRSYHVYILLLLRTDPLIAVSVCLFDWVLLDACFWFQVIMIMGKPLWSKNFKSFQPIGDSKLVGSKEIYSPPESHCAGWLGGRDTST